jgi:hypothetical protein
MSFDQNNLTERKRKGQSHMNLPENYWKVQINIVWMTSSWIVRSEKYET